MVIHPYQTIWIDTSSNMKSNVPLGTVSSIHSQFLENVAVGQGSVQNTSHKQIPVLMHSCTSGSIKIPANTPIAWLKPETTELIEDDRAPMVSKAVREMIVYNNNERLAQKILIRKGIDQRFQTKLFTLGNLIVEEDGLWTDEEHLSAPVDNVTLGEPDPPMHASTDDLMLALKEVYAQMGIGNVKTNPRKQKRLAMKASRLLDRVILHK